MKRLAILISCLLFLINVGLSQKTYHSKDKKAVSKYEKALSKFYAGKFEAALSLSSESLNIDANILQAYILKFRIYKRFKDTLGQIESLSRLHSKSSSFAPNSFFFLADLYFSRYEYEKALASYKNFLEFSEPDHIKRKEASMLINDCFFALQSLKSPQDVVITSLASINSKYRDYWPFINVYSNEIFFTRLEGNERNADENIMTYNIRDSIFSDLPFNSRFNEGTSSVTADGKYLFFSSNSPRGLGSQDIYVVERTKKGWRKPINVGYPVNSEAWDSQTAISADGKTLYFASTREGGKGGSDIYRSTLIRWDKRGRPIFSLPENLSINTSEDDMAPFIYADNRTLFFSTKGLPGMGAFDIFKTLMEGADFSEPVNLGYPINSNKNDLGFSLSQTGDFVLFGSERGGDMDVYTYKLPVGMRQKAVVNRSAFVMDEHGNPIKAMFNINGKSEILEPGEKISLFLNCGQNYNLYVMADAYNMYYEEINLQDSSRASSINKDIVLKKTALGDMSVLKNVIFDFDSYTLKESSFIQLSLLLDFLMSNPSVGIELAGHTDSVGGDDYNMSLSINRAKCIYDYLVKNGVSKHRLQYKGYGNTIPLVSNGSENGRSINRRTEFRIVSK
jgi:outer membrane protein OmpA-like peptidoglycan-associated protein/tetratricopeptide (TPR) repeat protein